MPIGIGDTLPDVTLRRLTADGIKEVTTRELFGRGKSVLFAVPGAFTPTCSDQHLPGYVGHAGDFRTKGVGLVACVAVNDPFVLGAWAQQAQVGDAVVMLSDGNGEFTRAVDLEMDGTGFGLGTRSKRYAMVVEDGVVRALQVESNPGVVEVSGADAVLVDL